MFFVLANRVLAKCNSFKSRTLMQLFTKLEKRKDVFGDFAIFALQLYIHTPINSLVYRSLKDLLLLF